MYNKQRAYGATPNIEFRSKGVSLFRSKHFNNGND